MTTKAKGHGAAKGIVMVLSVMVAAWRVTLAVPTAMTVTMVMLVTMMMGRGGQSTR